MKGKPLDNVSFLKKLMDQSPTGALAHLFVFDALCKYSDQVINDKEEILESMKGSIINPEAWIRTAEHVKESLDNRLGEETKEADA